MVKFRMKFLFRKIFRVIWTLQAVHLFSAIPFSHSSCLKKMYSIGAVEHQKKLFRVKWKYLFIISYLALNLNSRRFCPKVVHKLLHRVGLCLVWWNQNTIKQLKQNVSVLFVKLLKRDCKFEESSYISTY